MQPDPDAAKDFYAGLFAWEFENVVPNDAPGPYYVGRLRGRDVAAVGGPMDGDGSPVWSTYTAVASADDAAARVRAAGGTVIAGPSTVPDAGRMAVLADAEGAAFSVWEAHGFIGAQLVNEFGTWNFSELNTADPDGAARFYRAVFGWDVLTFGMGDSSFTFFTRPGYGDFLAEGNPEFRENMAADGAPAGFVDAVAWLVDQRNAQGAADAPPHWSITFAVDDADATALRAERLGAKVIVPPFDAPPVRMTVLADPQGAIFSASRYQPDGA
jgi:predicted enzyme related to lactoylglutathione lyase